jgi:hypothetical protein
VTRRSPISEELFAAKVIEHLGGWACSYGDAESNGAIDWWLTAGETRVGGVEVTVIGDQRLCETVSTVGDIYWEAPRANWCWMLSYAPSTNVKEARLHVEDLVVLCEAEAVTTPEQLHWRRRDQPCVRWYQRSGASLLGFPDAGRHGVIDVVPEGGDGCVLNDSASLVDWVEAEFEGGLDRKVRRIGEIEAPERHLFAIVHDSGMPMSHYHPLAFTDTLPARDPALPAGLTGLWLVPNWGRSVLWWHRAQGWSRAVFEDEPAPPSD